MTNFDSKGEFKAIETWELIAENRACNSHMAAKIIAGVFFGGAGIAFGMELLGMVIGSWFLKSAWDATQSIGKRLLLVRDCGCNAFVLDEYQLRIYIKQFGAEAVIQELEFAKEAGAELSPFAQNWLRTSTKQLPEAKEELIQLDSEQPERIVTKINEWEEFKNFNISKIIEQRIPNLFIVGLGRSGKGMLLANLLRQLKIKYDREIFLINGKDDPKEYGYFNGVVAVHEKLDCDKASASAVAEFIKASLKSYDDFAADNDGALLVIDEGTVIGAKLKTARATNLLNDRVIGITSSGDSSKKNIWLTAQSPYAGGNGSDLTALSQLTKIALVHKSNLGVLSDWKQAKIFKTFDTEHIAKLINKSEVNRAIYFGGETEWYSLEKLENYSTYDRDTQTYLKDIKSADANQATTVFDEVKQQYQISDSAQKILDWLEKRDSNDWFYYKNSDDKKRDAAFNMMLSRLGLLADERELNNVFTELLEIEKIDISDDELGIRLL